MSDQCICVYYDDYDSPEILEVQLPVARKSHVCGECGCKIEPGEQYEYVKGKWDGEFSTHKTCRLCRRIRDDLFDCGYAYGSIWQDVWESYGVGPNGEVKEEKKRR